VNVVANPECLFPDVDLLSLGGIRSFPPCRQSGAGSARSRDPRRPRRRTGVRTPAGGRALAAMWKIGRVDVELRAIVDAEREGEPVGRLTRSSFSTARPATLLTHNSSPLERYYSCAGVCRSPAPSRGGKHAATHDGSSKSRDVWKNSRTAATSANATGFTLVSEESGFIVSV
jgi:hypothetical protein